MFVECGSPASGERHQHGLPILRPLLKSVHELSADSGTTEGFDHEQFIDPGRWPARVERGMAVPGDIADQSPVVLNGRVDR
jgi:hypothetical protein